MSNPNAPKVINEYLEEDYENRDEEKIAEPRQSIIEALRQKAGKDLNTRKMAEDTFARQQAEKIDLQAMTPEEILIAKETLNEYGDNRAN